MKIKFNFWKASKAELHEWALLDEWAVLENQQFTQGENNRKRIRQIRKELRRLRK